MAKQISPGLLKMLPTIRKIRLQIIYLLNIYIYMDKQDVALNNVTKTDMQFVNSKNILQTDIREKIN